jgi:hypothetical protein
LGPVLKRRDPLPNGVAARVWPFADGAAGDSACEGDRPNPTTLVPDRVGVGELREFCLWGFPAGKILTVEITAPDGGIERRTICYWCYRGENATLWGSIPGNTLGTYHVVIKQGATQLAADFGLQPQRVPLLRVVGSEAEYTNEHPTRAGTSVRIVIAGFRPDTLIDLDFYYFPDRLLPEARYITTLAVKTDADGQRVYNLPTYPTDKGCYVLRTRPPVSTIGSRRSA